MFSAPCLWPWSKLTMFCSAGHVLASKVCFWKLQTRCGRCTPLCAFLQEAANVLVSMEFEGVGWILQRQPRKLMNAIWVQFLRRQVKTKKDSSPLHLWKYRGSTFYSFSSAIILLSSRISEVHVIIPVVNAGVHLWHKIIPWIFLLSVTIFISEMCSNFNVFQHTLNNSIRNYVAAYHDAEYQY